MIVIEGRPRVGTFLATISHGPLCSLVGYVNSDLSTGLQTHYVCLPTLIWHQVHDERRLLSP